MKRYFLLPLLLLATGLLAQQNAWPTANKNQTPIDPTQLQGPPPDTQAPTNECVNGLNVNLFQTGQITLLTADVLQFVSDNETPVGQIKLAIRLSGTGSGFPVDGNGNPISSLTFDCSQIGTQSIELWAMDLAGNSDYCETTIQIGDSFGYCDPNNMDSVIVCVKFGCNGAPMEGLIININSFPPLVGFPSDTLTDENGCVTIHFPYTANIAISPEKDDNPLNGVTTYDLLLISKHIIGTETLGNPYKMIAADVNKSGSITTFDLVELQKLILGIYSEFPNNTSWRFIDEDFMFLNPMNPFAAAFPESFGAPQGGSTDSVSFVAVKMGDVDCSAMLNGVPPPDYPDAFLAMPDTLLLAGQVYDIPLYMAENTTWQGYQFALDFNPQKLEWLGMQYHAGTGIGNWNVLQANNGKLSSSWIEYDAPVFFGKNTPIAVFKFRALSNGSLKDEISMPSQDLRAEGYTGLGAEKRDLLLSFVPQFKKGPIDPTADKNQPGPDPKLLGDFQPPTVSCLHSLSVNIMPTGMVSLWATDFLQDAHDNATPFNLLRFGIRKAGTGTGFPINAMGDPNINVVLTCSEVGNSISVELWAMDLAGNAAFCTTEILLQDNFNNCGSGLHINLCAQALCSGMMIETVRFNINGTSNFLPPFSYFDLSDNSGCMDDFLNINIPIASTFTVSAQKDENPLNGVTIADLELISKHIHGTEPFTEPWQWVAADVNKDGFITVEDSIELSKLILGEYLELPNNSSWRFVPSGYQFPAPNPLSQPIPDTISVANILSNMDTLFLGIKIGDLDCTAVTNVSGTPFDRNLTNEIGKAKIDLPRPNPTGAGSMIPIFLPANENLKLELSDLSGRVLWLEDLTLEKGNHTIEIPASAMPCAGVFVWRVCAGELVKAGKLVRY